MYEKFHDCLNNIFQSFKCNNVVFIIFKFSEYIFQIICDKYYTAIMKNISKDLDYYRIVTLKLVIFCTIENYAKIILLPQIIFCSKII